MAPGALARKQARRVEYIGFMGSKTPVRADWRDDQRA
jgi:hypothetical protein